MYDLIGDIHGHADELVQLLETLGYHKSRGVYGHPERKAIFLGDFINRGPKIRQVLEIVRPMIEEGNALAVMGNHEFNIVAFHTEDPDKPGEFLRCHNPKNENQSRQTVKQLEAQELGAYLDWFRTLPMWLDLDGLRVVHACWDEQAITKIAIVLGEQGGITPGFLHSACKKGSVLFESVDVLLKGREATLPGGMSFTDVFGNVFTEIRTRWYLPPEGQTYRKCALHSEVIIPCDEPLNESVVKEATPYPRAAKPVFVGHYCLATKRPEMLCDNVACLDYGQTEGFLCAYRWEEEQKLNNENFIWVAAKRL